MKYLLITLLCFTSISMAEGQWLCDEESGQLKNNLYYSCGLGQAMSEGRARAMAFNEAKDEFQKFCELSDNCRGHKVNLEPRRTKCTKIVNNKNSNNYTLYTCARLIIFEIKE